MQVFFSAGIFVGSDFILAVIFFAGIFFAGIFLPVIFSAGIFVAGIFVAGISSVSLLYDMHMTTHSSIPLFGTSL